MAALREYNRKRDFAITAEPAGKVGPAKGRHRFVIQKHAATRLHYDFRLELDGTLKSWAVPRGIPLKKGEKRLAVQVEDHPVSYMDFEGTIPKGEYGGGTVMVWDIGTYEPLSKAPSKELAGGKLHFVLSGKKLSGEWYLVQLKGEKDWLLIRGGEDVKLPARADDLSAISGRTMQQLSRGDRVWHSNKEPDGTKKTTRVKLPVFVEPMKALSMEEPPSHGDWLYEIKFDGFRAIALKAGQTARLISRNEKDFSGKFPDLVEAIGALPGRKAVIDGEIVALDPQGRSSFQLLQAYDLGQERPPLYFYAFDLLSLDGKDFRRKKLGERKEALRQFLGENIDGLVRYSDAVGTDPEPLLAQVRKIGLEGLIGKKVDSVYESGRRSGAWIKLKVHQQQEFVIGGFTAPEGTRKHFGALLVGVRDGRSFKLAGKVGTGFNQKLLRSLYDQMTAIEIDHCPFPELPEKRKGRYGQGVTAAEMKRCRWVRPHLVCQVRFSEWTREDRLRHPVFLGLREDKDASEVVREKHA